MSQVIDVVEPMYHQEQAIWLHLFDQNGQIIATEAEAERQRAEAAESEVARLCRALPPRHRQSGKKS